MFIYPFMFDTISKSSSQCISIHLQSFRQVLVPQVSLGPLRLVNKNFGTQMALALGELITFLESKRLFELSYTLEAELTNLGSCLLPFR
jgi:hypothetical protein